MKKNNKQIVFITGTDTGVGKTTVTCKLLNKYLNQGYNIAALKPVASGCDIKNNILINDDALCLKQVIDLAKNKNKNKKLNISLDNKKYSEIDYSFNSSLDWINPIRFEPPIAPHIAANMSNKELSIDIIMNLIWPRVKSWLDYSNNFEKNILFIEGAGGWQVPLNNKENYSDWVLALQKKLYENYSDIDFSVLLVVGMKLGCLNHTMLSAKDIKSSGCNFSGWVANQVDKDMLNYQENLDTLKTKLNMDYLYRFDYCE